ncbi:hypothetical protein M404DRAFT_30943 [Pisolithus tinctorius Marx 270]|uniref:Integrase catalytic domain-containing protein n=1 Tax=Pisolithus tinctorius Marx 270 TaxID=870435 RepID=A0A0C3NCZ6_PISTI|nr:hypothetical protein M404DRAFT_30943 [Pisolithus tinctorius Marx 270]
MTPPLTPIASTSTHPFQQISCDLVTDLPISDSYDSLLVVVDHGLTKGVILTPTKKTASAADIAALFFKKVYSRFGLYDKIISDRGPQFASAFAKELASLLGYSLALSTAYHPQTDGETEHVNQEVETYLCIFCQNDPTSWVNNLPMAEFTHNHCPHSVTHQSPFYLMYRYEPKPLLSLITETHLPTAESRLEELRKAREEALAAHDLARKTMKDRSSRPFTPFQKGDKVWLEAHNLKCSYENRKLAPKREGPFTISDILSPVMYRLAIPSQWKIHNVFHASLLLPYRENNVHRPNFLALPPDLINEEEEYEVEAIVGHKRSSRGHAFLIKWKGYPSSENSWQKESHLEHADDTLSTYKKCFPKDFPPQKQPTRCSTRTIRNIVFEMPPRRYTYPREPSHHHTPFARRQRQPASDQMIASYRLFIADPAIIGTIYHEVDEDSPLDLVYHATIQALRLEELSRYQVPLLLKLFDVLGGADLVYNVCQYPTLIAPPPPGSRRPSTATSPLVSSVSPSPPASSPSSSSHSSHSLRRADRPRTCCLSGPNPQSCESHDSPSEVDPETAFGVSRAELDYTLNIVETLAQLLPTPVLNAMTEFDRPLTPSDPRYRQACYVCHCLGHIHVNCGLYECPLCHTTRPGYTQAQCPSICPCRPLQDRIATPALVDDRTLVRSKDNDLYDNDNDFDDSTISNMSREPYGE